MQKPLIFVVDDQDVVRDVLTVALMAEGYQVECFDNIQSFGQRLQLGHPKLILLDEQLPDGSGLEICKGLKTMGKYQDIQVILMSSDSKFAEEFKHYEANDILTRPFELEDLISKVSLLMH